MVKTVRFRTPVFQKHGKNCARNHGSVSKVNYKLCAQDLFVKKHEKNCARKIATTSTVFTLFSTILQLEPLMLRHVWGIKILKTQIRSAQNVGKVWISRKKSSQPHLGHPRQFYLWTEEIQKKVQNFA